MNNTVIIEPVYPHSLLIHISKLIDGNESILQNEKTFLQKYSSAYSNVDNEVLLLKLAYDKNIVSAFFECNKREQWRKRVLIEKSVNLLVGAVAEKYAVMVVESLMFAFGWRFRLDIVRRWEATDDEKAMFHEKTALERKGQNDIIGQLHIINNNKKLDVSEYMESDTNLSANTTKNSVASDDEDMVRDDSYYNVDPKKASGRESNRKKASISAKKNKSNSVENKQKPEPVLTKPKIEDARYYKLMNIRKKRVLKKAFQGNASSQCEMGDYYAEKDSNHLDYNEAAKWYSESADNGYKRAFFELGRLYDQNPPEIEGAKEKAFNIYKDMAEQGLPTAQCILGMKYWFGDGVEIDFKKAVQWLTKAADQKHEDAIRNLADLYSAMNDIENANKWYKVGAAAGDDYCRRKIR